MRQKERDQGRVETEARQRVLLPVRVYRGYKIRYGEII